MSKADIPLLAEERGPSRIEGSLLKRDAWTCHVSVTDPDHWRTKFVSQKIANSLNMNAPEISPEELFTEDTYVGYKRATSEPGSKPKLILPPIERRPAGEPKALPHTYKQLMRQTRQEEKEQKMKKNMLALRYLTLVCMLNNLPFPYIKTNKRKDGRVVSKVMTHSADSNKLWDMTGIVVKPPEDSASYTRSESRAEARKRCIQHIHNAGYKIDLTVFGIEPNPGPTGEEALAMIEAMKAELLKKNTSAQQALPPTEPQTPQTPEPSVSPATSESTHSSSSEFKEVRNGNKKQEKSFAAAVRKQDLSHSVNCKIHPEHNWLSCPKCRAALPTQPRTEPTIYDMLAAEYMKAKDPWRLKKLQEATRLIQQALTPDKPTPAQAKEPVSAPK